MPYANISEAFTTYTESFSGGADTSTLDSIKNPFNIKTTDPADDFSKIASNYTSDGYNITYSGRNEWDILDEDIRGLNTPANQNVAQSPDRLVASSLVDPVTTNRRLGDRVWDRPTGAQVDESKRARDIALQAANPQGVRMIAAPNQLATTGGSTPLPTGAIISNTNNIPMTSGFSANTLDGAPVADYCSDETCLKLLNHILGCENCAVKFKKLMNVSSGGGGNFFGIEIPEINFSKLMFWIIIVILIVAVYELLNSLFRRFTKI